MLGQFGESKASKFDILELKQTNLIFDIKKMLIHFLNKHLFTIEIIKITIKRLIYFQIYH
ncbi:hypothetical protein PCE01_03060 [Pediococcus cellicola]|nr:hypothetical protein PCE01_03060 [Pediococcus cellicola]